jgi:hypothetical protein
MTVADPSEEIDEPEEPAIDHDDETQRRVSFFASSAVLDADPRDYAAWVEIEEADEAVCARVWDIFAKDSTARGFDARSARSKRASAALAERWEKDGTAEVRRAARDRNLKEDEAMGTKTSEAISDREQEVLDVYNRLQKDLGRVPSNPEIVAAIKAPWASPTTVRFARAGLIDRGLAEARPRGGRLDSPAPVEPAKTTRPAPTTRPTPQKPAAQPERPAQRARDAKGDPLVAELVARRDAAAAQVAKLDAAIAAVRAAS